ncbi:MAG: heat shock protein HspQ [Nitrospiria bacterium]
MNTIECKFFVGQLVHHLLFDYRGVVVDVDPEYQGTEEWYRQVARSKPPKDQPWYHVLVHNGKHMTYVAERNLKADPSKSKIKHPLIEHFFTGFEKGKYIRMMS